MKTMKRMNKVEKEYLENNYSLETIKKVKENLENVYFYYQYEEGKEIYEMEPGKVLKNFSDPTQRIRMIVRSLSMNSAVWDWSESNNYRVFVVPEDAKEFFFRLWGSK